jgi:werner syndrome ATP-dependent helicase
MESGPSESDVSADGLIAELLDMGFDFDAISAAIAAVGAPRRAEVLELVLGRSGAAQARRIGGPAPSRAQPQPARRGARVSNPRGRFRQSSITDRLASCGGGTKDSGREETTSLPGSAAPVDSSVPDGVVPCSNPASESQVLVDGSMGEWDRRDRISAVLQKHFGFSCLKSFQMEALDAWFAHRDCLVLAATGSGMPLSFTSD